MSLTVQEAEAELAKAINMEQEIEGELAGIEFGLMEQENTAGARLLEARKVGDTKKTQAINTEIQKLRQRCDATRSEKAAARTAVTAARRALNMSRGGALRAQAAEIMDQVNKRQEKTSKLLSALKEHEGVSYVPEPRVDPSGAIIPGLYAESKTARLLMDVDTLIKQAKITEGQIVQFESDPPRGGRMSGGMVV